ncbi:AAA family ATPase [Sneathiella chinensis]|uniref:AAA family ATPase n=1 Tax=Sneathiella chinensis TaxID=349750 RepID=UPI0024E0D96E|nr:ATP-binding protein [Sneathiella chinensis]
MLIDFSVANFRSFQDEQLFSMNAEGGPKRLQGNYSDIENGRFSILRSAAIYGPNASGKSNLLKAFKALSWLISNSKSLSEEDSIPAYEPFKLSSHFDTKEIEFKIEFIVPSGVRYEYSVSYTNKRVVSESLFAFPKRQRALIFKRDKLDTWETIKFGGSYKGGDRRFPFFPNSTYISRAGNDASAPKSIREIVRYFRSIITLDAGVNIHLSNFYDQEGHLNTVSDLICLADTGVKKITAEESSPEGLRLPSDMPDFLKRVIIEQNSVSYKFWHEAQNGQLVKFEKEEMSDGTVKLFEILPMLLMALSSGTPIFIDELDGHLHTNIVSLIFELFNDPLANSTDAQIIVTTHDTNLMDPNKLRRDQLWLVQKENGSSILTSLDAYDKDSVRPNSPFEAFYKDGRFGALPSFSYVKIREAITQMSIKSGYLKRNIDDA